MEPMKISVLVRNNYGCWEYRHIITVDTWAALYEVVAKLRDDNQVFKIEPLRNKTS